MGQEEVEAHQASLRRPTIPEALSPACFLAPAAAQRQQSRRNDQEKAMTQMKVLWHSIPVSRKVPLALDAMGWVHGSIYHELAPHSNPASGKRPLAMNAVLMVWGHGSIYHEPPQHSIPASGKRPLALDAAQQSVMVWGHGSIYHEPVRPSPVNLNLQPALPCRPGHAKVEHSHFALSIQ